MQVREYSPAEAKAGSCLFLGIFDTDPWIGFHGTSNHAEATIDHSGFEWREQIYSREDIERLLLIFDELFWEGSVEGRGILATYSQGDFRTGASENRKAVYFGESSLRSLLYSRPDWAGGESARSIRRAFKDLDDFLTIPAVRQQAYNAAFASLAAMIQGAVPADYQPFDRNAPTAEELCRLRLFLHGKGIRTRLVGRSADTDPVVPSEALIRSRLAALESLRYRAEIVRSTYTHGVVYAVRFCDADLSFMQHSNGGLLSRRPIPGSRVVAKAIVRPHVYEVYRARRTPSGMDLNTEALLRAIERDGLLSRLNSARR